MRSKEIETIDFEIILASYQDYFQLVQDIKARIKRFRDAARS
jgi:hypothetical protein